MELADLGFTDWFRERAPENTPPGGSPARVTAVDKGGYLVRGTGGEAFAEVSGNLLFTLETGADYPVVGDWVYADYHNDGTLAIIHALFPRKTFLRRKTAGKKVDFQMIAANIDTALIVQPCDLNFNLRRLERYLVMVRDGGIRPMVLLSKSDLIGPEGVEERVTAIRNAGIRDEVIAYSVQTGAGLSDVRQALQPGNTFCLLGSSGVGKTTLLNYLVGEEAFKTNTVRDTDGKGRHTTARRQLVVLGSGAMLVDTPGMRELGNVAAGTGIDENFADVVELAAGCRFNDCSHTSETGCAVLAAVRSGELGEDRYRSYLKLARESAHYQMSYLEKRQKDRKFGQFVKSVMKHNRKNRPTG